LGEVLAGMQMVEIADRIVAALVKRAEQDSGLTLDAVQRLLMLRVREEAVQAGVPPRELMSAVWRSWERHNRPAMLGDKESLRIVERLVEKGLLLREDQPGEPPIIRWSGLSGDELEERLDSLDHEERLFVRGVIEYLRRAGSPVK
jgi:hypothetical protein